MRKTNNKLLITGGAGFIGSNLVAYFLSKGHTVVCLDNLSTGFRKNLEPFLGHPRFTFIEGDIRNPDTCRKAVHGCDYVLHEAALGSVPRSISDPVSTNASNIDGFLNMLLAARDEKVKRFVYAASSSTYGDAKALPKVEHEIGRPLSPYAITKYVNELYAGVFADTYGMECIGLRYFNVFGKNQSPEGAYAAVIPLWVKALIRHKQPVINGDGSYSRDFTYIANVIRANELALFTPTEQILKKRYDYYNLDLQNKDAGEEVKRGKAHAFSEVFNVAYGGNTTLNELYETLRDNLAKHDPAIGNIEPVYGPVREGDIPHSQASILKAKIILGYQPEYDARKGFELACEWYYRHLG